MNLDGFGWFQHERERRQTHKHKFMEIPLKEMKRMHAADEFTYITL